MCVSYKDPFVEKGNCVFPQHLHIALSCPVTLSFLTHCVLWSKGYSEIATALLPQRISQPIFNFGKKHLMHLLIASLAILQNSESFTYSHGHFPRSSRIPFSPTSWNFIRSFVWPLPPSPPNLLWDCDLRFCLKHWKIWHAQRSLKNLAPKCLNLKQA